MIFDILINHYKEDEKIINRMLSSIDRQKGIRDEDQIHVIVCSDGTSIDEDICRAYSVPIKLMKKEHHGVCPTRNSLLEVSKADYVIFADMDDYFCSDLGLNRIIETAHMFDPDIISANYYVEYPDGHTFATEKKDILRIHAKAFKRLYLIENDICFPDMNISGDMYMNYLAFNLTDKIIWLNEPWYVWAYNKDSITRKNDTDTLAITYPHVVRCYQLLLESLFKRDRYDISNRLFPAIVSMLYLDSINNYGGTSNEEAIQQAEKASSEFIKLYNKYFVILPINYIKQQYMSYVKKHNYKNSGTIDHMISWVSKKSGW